MGRLLLAVVSFLFLISSAYADHSGTYSSPAAAWAACNVLGDCSQQAASGTVSLSGGGSCALAGRYRYPYDHYFYYCDGAGISCPSGSTWSDTVQTCEVPPPPPCDSGITKTFSGVAIQNSDVPSSVCNLGCSYAGPGGPTTLFTLADGSFKWTSQYISDGLNCSSSTAGVSDVSSVFASAVPIPKIVSTATDGTQVASYTPTAGSAGDQLPFSCFATGSYVRCENTAKEVICVGTDCRSIVASASTSYNAVSTSTKTNSDGTSETTVIEYSATLGSGRTTTTTLDAQGNFVGSPVITNTTGLNNPAAPSTDGTVSNAPKGVDVPVGELSNSNVDISSTGFTQTSYVSFGTPACPAPVSFTVKGQQVSFSFDRICDGLAMFGILLVAVGAFIGVRIFLSMFPAFVGG